MSERDRVVGELYRARPRSRVARATMLGSLVQRETCRSRFSMKIATCPVAICVAATQTASTLPARTLLRMCFHGTARTTNRSSARVLSSP